MNRLTFKGQSLLELVVGISIVAVVLIALVVTTTYSLRNTQFSKNQSLATKFAQENLEKVRTIKIANYGVCLSGQTTCSTWEEIWATTFGTYVPGSGCTITPCTFYIPVPPADPTCTTIGPTTKPVCLKYSASDANLGNGFTGQIIIEDEAGAATTQKRVTSRVFWTDTTGVHSSDLVTVFSKL